MNIFWHQDRFACYECVILMNFLYIMSNEAWDICFLSIMASRGVLDGVSVYS